MNALDAGPEDAGSLVAGALLAGSLEAGALVVSGGGALLVTGVLGGGGALVVTGALDGGGAALLVTGSLVGGEPVVGGGALDGGFSELGGGALDAGAEDDGPEPRLVPDDGVDGDEDDGGALDVPEDDEDAGGVVVPWEVPPPVLLDDVPPVVLSVTYCPNRSSVPAAGFDAVTRASSGGRDVPEYPAASPLPVSVRLARAKVAPVTSGTVRGSAASNVVSCVPVVPTGRSMPRSGRSTSTRASCSIFRGAGRTATTEERSYPFHFRLPFSNVTEIRFVSPAKGRSGFPHEHFTAGSPCSSTRIAIPACSRESKGTAFPFL